MKKIILIAIVLMTIMSCSSNDNSKDNNLMKEKLIGSWKIVGYADDIGDDPITGTNYHPVDNGGITSFYINNTFDDSIGSVNYNGNYTLSLDSVLTMNYTQSASGSPYTYVSKIYLLNNNELQLSCVSADLCDTYYYEKVTTP